MNLGKTFWGFLMLEAIILFILFSDLYTLLVKMVGKLKRGNKIF